MNIYVTGGSGFLGRDLIRELIARGDSVKALSISQSDAEVVRELGAEPIIGSLMDVEIMENTMAGCESVIHLAALMKMFGNWKELYTVNVDGARNVMTAAKSRGVRRLVHISAAGVLCDGSPVINADETWSTPEKPLGAYAGTKVIAERMILNANSSEFSTIVIRPPCIWGKGDRAMLPTLAQMVRDGKWKWIQKGDYPYSTCHVRNACEGIIKAMDKGRGGEIYFLSDKDKTSFRDFFDPLLRTQDVDPGNDSMPLWMARGVALLLESIWNLLKLKNEPPLAKDTVALFFTPLSINDEKARRELGYVGSVTMEEGLAELRNT